MYAAFFFQLVTKKRQFIERIFFLIFFSDQKVDFCIIIGKLFAVIPNQFMDFPDHLKWGKFYKIDLWFFLCFLITIFQIKLKFDYVLFHLIHVFIDFVLGGGGGVV